MKTLTVIMVAICVSLKTEQNKTKKERRKFFREEDDEWHLNSYVDDK